MATVEDLERAIAALPEADFQVSRDRAAGVLAIEVKEHVWPRPKALEILPSWRFRYGFRVEDVGPERVDEILDEIHALEEGIARIRKEAMSADDLMEEARRDWTSQGIFDLVDYLKKRPSAELAPHVVELADHLLGNPRNAMGVLDVIAAAGPGAFRSVAAQVYALEGHREWVLELLGLVADDSPEAIALYREALEGDDADERDKALAAVKAANARELAPTLRARLEAWEEEAKAEAIALLGFLGEDYVALVSAHLPSLTGDSFGALLRAMRGLDVSALEAKFLERYRSLDPADRTTLEAIEGLVGLGIEEPATMAPVVREHFLPRGGFFQQRAEELLRRFTMSSAATR